jgi:hypothetical protein
MVRDMSAHRDNSSLAYVTHDDILSLPNFKGETLIGISSLAAAEGRLDLSCHVCDFHCVAIKAPSGTTLEVPDPDEVLIPFSYNKPSLASELLG